MLGAGISARSWTGRVISISGIGIVRGRARIGCIGRGRDGNRPFTAGFGG